MLGQSLLQTLALQADRPGVLRRSLDHNAQFPHRQTHRVQPHPVAGDGDQGRRLFLAQHHIGGQQFILVIQTQRAGVGQQPVGVTRQGRHHRHHLPPGADVAVDFRGHGGRLGGVAQDGRAELQHHDLGGAEGPGDRLRFLFIGDESEGGSGHRGDPEGGVWWGGRGGLGHKKNPPGGPGGVFGFCVSRLGGAHHPVPARKGMVVVVPVVVIMDATRPVAEAAIWVVIMLARRSSTGGVRLKILPQGVPGPRTASTPRRTNFSRTRHKSAISPPCGPQSPK